MTKASHETAKGSFIERSLRWDERFNRRLGVVATVAAGGIAVLGAPAVATVAAGIAAFSFVDAELVKRFNLSLQKRK